MASVFTALERAHIVQKAKQLQASLISVFASIQDGAQQAVDALSQHATAPGASQYLAQGTPRLPELFLSQQRSCLIEALFPQDLSRSAFLGGGWLTLLIGFDLPDPRQGLESLWSPTPNQGCQSLAQHWLIGKQAFRKAVEVAAQFLVDLALPGLQLLVYPAQALGARYWIPYLTILQLNQGKLSVYLLGNLKEGVMPLHLLFGLGAQSLPGGQMLFQSPGGMCLLELGRAFLDRFQCRVGLLLQTRDLPPQRAQQGSQSN